jgi:phage shock protein C
MEKKLTRSRKSRVIAGVMGGLGEFFGIDPTLLRLGYAIITVFSGFVPGIIGYLLAILIVPEEPHITPSEPEKKDDAQTV